MYDNKKKPCYPYMEFFADVIRRVVGRLAAKMLSARRQLYVVVTRNANFTLANGKPNQNNRPNT